MHVPDGFLDLPVSLATGVIAAAGIAVALPLARREAVGGRTAPLVGMVATVIFAAQMINFPVGAGTSGHLMGGALAAVLVGPGTAVLCLSAVLIVQAIVFADGGVTAVGTNITLIGLVTVVVGWTVFRLLMRVLPPRSWSITTAATVGALLSVPVASAVFVLLFAVGGTVDVPMDAVLTAMLGWHTLIGVGEAAITALIVSAALTLRPDLVYGAQRAESTTPGAREEKVFA